MVVALEHRDRSSCWTFSLETDALSGIVIEKPILMTSYPDGEGEFKRCNKQLHKRVAECVRALNVMEEVSIKLGNILIDAILVELGYMRAGRQTTQRQ